MGGVVADTASPSNAGTLVCDLDGVVYVGTESVPGAGEALSTLQDRGMRIVFVTNNSTATPGQVAARIAERTGYPADADQVVTSSVVTAAHLAGGVATAFVIGEAGLFDAIHQAGITTVSASAALTADAVVVGLDRGIDYAKLAAATRAIRAGARFVATNTDVTFPTPSGLEPGGGAIVAAIEVATGVAPVVCGKPHAPMRQEVRRRVEPPAVVVGDRVETDLALAAGEGWRKVLVLTGVTSELAGIDEDHRPDLVLESLAELPDAIDRLLEGAV